MNLRKSVILTSILSCFYAVLPSAIYSCGPFFPTAVFSYRRTPDFDLKQFVHGKLGVIHPGLKYSYLFVAYRYLSKQDLNNDEQSILYHYWRSQGAYTEPGNTAQNHWLEARARVSQEKVEIQRYREVRQYQSYENCQPDAFRNAAETLDQRIKEFGAQSLAIQDWVRAQDAVFSNCHSGTSYPAQARPSDPPIIRADRAYQSAAAHFYSADFKAAEAAFHTISRDKSSPWNGLANYLAARAIIRGAALDFDGESPAFDPNELARAEARLRAIVDDPALKLWHAMSRERIGLIEARLHPKERLRELAIFLSKPRKDNLLHQQISDFLFLIERNADVTDTDLTDWINTMKGMASEPSKKSAESHALATWQRKQTLPWLIAAMAGDRDGVNSAVLLNPAQKIANDSPAYLSAALYRARVKSAESRANIGELLKMPEAELPTSARNRFLHEGLVNAQNFDGFLEAVARQPAQIVWEEEDENFFDKDGNRETGSRLRSKSGMPLFDLDSTRAFNRQLPLKLLLKAVNSKSLPREIWRELASSAWTKALLLDDTESADAVAPLAMEARPQVKPYLLAYVKETDPLRKHFAGVFAILHFPGMTPMIRSGVGRETPFGKVDSYRRNWWCGKSKAEYLGATQSLGETAELYDFNVASGQERLAQPPPLLFLSPEEIHVADTEWKKLSSHETGPNLLAKSVLGYAKHSPADPRIPEALDLSLRALRYDCSDATYPELSHKVFRFLHSKYPNSAAAKRNRPWG